MANEWLDPDAGIQGGLSKSQEIEVADLIEEGFGLNPKYGLGLNTLNILGAAKKIYGMSDEDWDKMLKDLPYYGQFQDQDIDAIQEHFLSKYPLEDILSIKVPEMSMPWNWENIGEKYGVGAGVIPSDEAYKAIMSVSPDALSGIKTTGLDSYKGPIAETIEWKDVPKMANGGLINGTAIVGEAGPELVTGNATVTPLSDFKGLGIGSAGKWTRMVEGMTTQELFDEGYIDAIEKEERDRKDRRHQQGVEAQRRARQYDAIAKRIWT